MAIDPQNPGPGWELLRAAGLLHRQFLPLRTLLWAGKWNSTIAMAFSPKPTLHEGRWTGKVHEGRMLLPGGPPSGPGVISPKGNVGTCLKLFHFFLAFCKAT